jgi:hypothetical protein
MIIDNSNTENLDLDQKEIYNSLIKMTSGASRLYMYSGMVYRYILEDKENNLDKNVIESKMNSVLDILIKEKLIKKTAIYFSEDEDYNLDEETIEHFEKTGELYNPQTGMLVDEEDAQISYVYETYKRN